MGERICAIRHGTLFSFMQFRLLTYAHCTGSDSEHALASNVRQPISSHVYHINGCQL